MLESNTNGLDLNMFQFSDDTYENTALPKSKTEEADKTEQVTVEPTPTTAATDDAEAKTEAAVSDEKPAESVNEEKPVVDEKVKSSSKVHKKVKSTASITLKHDLTYRQLNEEKLANQIAGFKCTNQDLPSAANEISNSGKFKNSPNQEIGPGADDDYVNVDLKISKIHEIESNKRPFELQNTREKVEISPDVVKGQNKMTILDDNSSCVDNVLYDTPRQRVTAVGVVSEIGLHDESSAVKVKRVM